MMNWCRKHDCFEVCPYCMAETRLRYGMESTVAERHPPKVLIEGNPDAPPDPRLPFKPTSEQPK